MKTDGKDKAVGRRDFLRAIGTGAAAGAAVAATTGAAEAKPETAAERKKSRYKESDHVKTYYQQNRL
jgi:ribosomal protein L12E/L44/L45/RPP1/RPP2